MEEVCLFRTVPTPDAWVSVQKEIISMLFRLKLCHELEGDGVWYGIVVVEVRYPIPHSIEITFRVIKVIQLYICISC